MKCWLCGNIADSKEHKLKKSLLKSYFNEEFKIRGGVLHLKENSSYKLNGPNSDRIKFEKVMCQNCNNNITQNADFAFDIFASYLSNNFDLIYKDRIIDFQDVYGDEFENNQRDLFRYFTKILACDLSQYNFKVPYNLRKIFKKNSFFTRLKITFSINEDIIIDNNPLSILKFGSLITTKKNLQTRSEWNTKYRFEIDISYIRVNFFYNCLTDEGLGSDWIANKRYIYLGRSKEFSSL